MDLTLKNFKALNIGYRKSRNTIGSNMTSVLLGEVQNLSKIESKSEKELISGFLVRMKKSLTGNDSEEAKEELELVKSWLPTLMTQNEILNYIKKTHNIDQSSIIDNKGKFTGIVVKELKDKASGQDVSSVIRLL
jgi:uncharacterized protein YqeY